MNDVDVSQDAVRDHISPVLRRPAPAPISIAPIQMEQPAPIVDARPPAARRAASTGGIDTPSSYSRSRANSGAQWAPGMPLPPPPPGPPPQPSSRSQSLSRAPENNTTYQPTRRPPAISNLGPVPPTPADWVDEDAAPARQRTPPLTMPTRSLQLDTSIRALSLNTTNLGTNAAVEPSSDSGSGSGPASGGLARAHAVRGEPKSIRERRSESRTGRTAHPDEQSNNPWAEAITPSDITVPPMTVLGRRPTVTRGTPRSARSMQLNDGPTSSRSLGTPRLMDDSASRGSTPRPLNSARRPEAPTPPFSPDHLGNASQYTSPGVPPKSLPTPPPQSRLSGTPLRSAHSYHRSISEAMSSSQASPAPPTPRALALVQSGSADKFSQDSMRRHKDFAEREAAAETDEDRVRLFADFIVAESRLRRQRYANAIDAMGSEILEVTRDLFRPYAVQQRAASNSFSSTGSSKPEPLSGRLTPQSGSRPGSRQDNVNTPASGAPSPSQGSSGRPDSAWFNTYMPSLSPIESVAQSSKADESSSRGRPSSRWWEVGDAASSGSQTGRIERSKRESKYMGQLREQLQWDESGTPSTSGTPRGTTTAGSSSQTSYSTNDYPPEKVGWHEASSTASSHKSPSQVSYQQQLYSPAILTPKALMHSDPNQLDVSRLVTLPPPYPRHHPAVNNNHPDLTTIRIQVRGLSDLVEVESAKARFEKAAESLREEQTSAASSRRASFRAGIQREIEAGSMSYADAAASEVAFKTSEHETTKAQTKASYELFQESVVNPLNDLLMEKINLATSLSETLKAQITLEAASASHTATQEEGDEQPELLEKLTLLKWIFEASDTLHREVFDLVGERNDRYKEMVTLSYKLSGNLAKSEEAANFFAADATKRAIQFEKESVARTVAFMDVIESHVVRGVEVQLSAFWDIAPGLNEILEKIPTEITKKFSVVIPTEEYEDNPGYRDWPLQYLWTLLEHGEKSAYQFMESQINLLCLLHEVKSTVAAAKGRVQDAELRAEAVSVDADMIEAKLESVKDERRKEERRLTDDLKEKVRCVEELWASALGTEMDEVKGRVKEFLVEEGGWEGFEDAE